MGQISLVKNYLDKLFLSQVDGISFQVREKEYYESINKKKFLLSDDDYIYISKLFKRTKKKLGIAIADIDKIDFFESINVDFYKIIRNDITNMKLLNKILSTGKKVFISTGLSSDEDIKFFLDNFGNYRNFVLNHTQLSYDVKDCNLKAIISLREKYNVPVSFGSHCSNKNVIYMSLCFNPSDILFYVKLDNKINYPDDKHSVLLKNCISFTDNILKLRNAIGDGIKEEFKNKIK